MNPRAGVEPSAPHMSETSAKPFPHEMTVAAGSGSPTGTNAGTKAAQAQVLQPYERPKHARSDHLP
jgi:hypothetical protein